MNRLATAAAVLTGWGIRGETITRRTTGFGNSRRRRHVAELADAPGRAPAALAHAVDGPPRAEVHWHEGGTGEPLVLLNGIGVSGLVWPRSWVGELERRYRVIRIDNRGTGWSRCASAPFTIADLADDIVAVLDSTDVASARFLGMSMGGMIAQELAVRHPERVDRLVLVSTIPPAPAHVPTADYRPLYAPWVGLALSRIRLDSKSQAERLARFYLCTASRDFRPGPELVDELAEQLHARPTPLMEVIQQSRAIVAWRRPERLAGLRVPTTIVAGRDDPVVKVRNSELLGELIPEARHVELAGVGHLVPWEAPAKLSRLLAG